MSEPQRSPSEKLWSPSQEKIASANLTPFITGLSQKFSPTLGSYESLYQWSLAHPELFWPEICDFTGVIFRKRWEEVLRHPNKMPGAEWFVGAELNFAENLLRFRDDHPALVFCSEKQKRVELSYRELYDSVAAVAAYLKAAGVVAGDRVCGFLPNIPEAVIAMLATSSLGAVWSSCSPDFGAQGVLDRFGQIAPKVLFVSDGYYYAGKTLDSLERVREFLEKLPSVEQVVVVPFTNSNPDISQLSSSRIWSGILHDFRDTPLEFASLPFNHPLYIMYSSGTTGAPKCIVHGAGGTLLQHAKELVLHTDLKREDKIFYFTTCGWMMWNWLVSSLSVGATVMLYDGSPFYPSPTVLFDFAEREGITIFGTSAKYIAALEKAGAIPRKSHDLRELKTVLSTGSPLLPESFDYVYREIKEDVCLSSISGGTDIISCFALGNPILPIYRGEIQCRGLGMKVEVFDETGRAVVGSKGELVCTAPFPSMPIYFWNDPNGAKYRSSYFETYKNIWRHGDWIELTANGGVIIYGRSDTTLNPGGVRIGTAEIYREVEKLEEVLESLVTAQSWEGDERIVLFVRLKPSLLLTDELAAKIRQALRRNLTPRHVPAKIIAVADIPRTISGKISELAVKNVIHGLPVKNTDALANPQSLENFRNLSELKS